MCPVQRFKTAGQLQNMLWENETLQDLELRCFSELYPISHKAPNDIN